MPTDQDMAFRRFGRCRHLRIEFAEDLVRVLELDEAHWVATGAPIETINCDPVFLALVDTDHNGRIMCFEVKDAIAWLLKNLRDTGGVAHGSQAVRLDAINTDNAEGRRIRQSCLKILERLGLSDSDEIALEQVRRIKASVEGAAVSEAGVVLAEAAGDAEVRQFISDIIATVGGSDHPGGSQGVDQGRLDEFLAHAQAFLDWLSAGEVPAGQTESPVMPLGERTPEAFALLADLRGKIDQYFAQCEAVAFDARAAGRIGISDADVQALDFSDPQAVEAFMAGSPLAEPRSERMLWFEKPINPYYAPGLERLRREVIEPALGRPAGSLSERDWREVKEFFAEHEAWSAAKAGSSVERLGAETLREYLGEKFRRAAEALIAESTQTALVLDNIRLTEKLLLYQAHLLTLANNFVSFPHLYDPASRAVFEMGTLVMDGRRFNLSVRVCDRAAHSAIAGTGSMFVLYAEIIPPGQAGKYEIAVPVTSGGKGNLCVGKRGVFEDVSGGEFDVRVVQIIENPISMIEALVSPFRRLGRLLSGKIEAITTSAEKKLDATAAGAMEKAKPGAGAPPAGAARQNRGLLAGGLLMGGGVAVAALVSAFAYIGKTLSNVENYAMILAVIGIAILAVIVPTSIVGMRKLRRRDLSAILEGSGWAINARMRLTYSQARFFTQRPGFHGGAKGLRRKVMWLLLAAFVAAAAIVVAWCISRR